MARDQSTPRSVGATEPTTEATPATPATSSESVQLTGHAVSTVPQRRRSRAAAEFLALAQSGPVPKPKRRRRPAARPPRIVRDAIDTLDGTVSGLLQRGRTISLDDRDPAFIEQQVRWMGPLVDIWFRGEVRHIERIPASGAALCVGNHSGGLLTPDSWVLMANFVRHFGTDRQAYALAHSAVMGAPRVGDWLRKVGTLSAHPDNARAALARDAVVLVYPGGDEDVFRSWRDRNRIHLARRTGFIRLALQERVPIVPMVSIGGHETALIVGDGERIARALQLNRLRIKSLPMVVGPPWGISPGDLLGHIPLPAKIVVDIGKPIDFHKQFGDLDARDPAVIWACYHYVEGRMQKQLDKLAKERRFPILG